jgi:hypothetical protein
MGYQQDPEMDDMNPPLLTSSTSGDLRFIIQSQSKRPVPNQTSGGEAESKKEVWGGWCCCARAGSTCTSLVIFWW